MLCKICACLHSNVPGLVPAEILECNRNEYGDGEHEDDPMRMGDVGRGLGDMRRGDRNMEKVTWVWVRG